MYGVESEGKMITHCRSQGVAEEFRDRFRCCDGGDDDDLNLERASKVHGGGTGPQIPRWYKVLGVFGRGAGP